MASQIRYQIINSHLLVLKNPMIKVGENQKMMNFYVYMKVDHLIPFFLKPCAHSNIFWLILNWKIIFIKKWGFHVYHIVYFSTMESNISNNIEKRKIYLNAYREFSHRRKYLEKSICYRGWGSEDIIWKEKANSPLKWS